MYPSLTRQSYTATANVTIGTAIAAIRIMAVTTGSPAIVISAVVRNVLPNKFSDWYFQRDLEYTNRFPSTNSER